MRLNIFSRQEQNRTAVPLFDEVFLRRLERLNFRTVPSLRGVMLGERRSRNLRPALDFSDHRPYSPGDDLRHVDWNAYGRHEELFVKLGEATQSVNIHILLDRSPSMAWEPGWEAAPEAVTKWTGARRLAGALSYLGLSGGERLIITPFAADLDESFGPTHGKTRALAALQFLAGLRPAPPPRREVEGGLAHSLTTYAQSYPSGGLLILISDLLDAAVSAEAGQGATWLAEGLLHLSPPRWQVIVMHVLSQQELHPTVEGDFDFQDMESGESLPFHLDRHTLGQYSLRMRRWCRELQQVCARRGATYAQILAEWPFERAVVPYLRQRRVIQ
jgi:uncharacterized protein (DUF58 family)